MVDEFIIEVEVESPEVLGPGAHRFIVHVDLTQPEFEKAVLAAAGRFRSLKRTRRTGGRPRKYITCPKHGRKVWKGGGKKCDKCEAEKRHEETGSARENRVEADGNQESRPRLGGKAGVKKSKQRKSSKHEDPAEAVKEERDDLREPIHRDYRANIFWDDR